MITREQALNASEVHYGNCTRETGPRGGVKVHMSVCRVNGKAQTWKTRPDDYRVPLKYGLRGYGELTPTTAPMFHTPEDCPLNDGADHRKLEGRHDGFIQGRYLWKDKMDGIPEFYRAVCSCGFIGQDVSAHFQAQMNLDAHISQFNV